MCDLYKAAPQLKAEGVHVVSTDEKTGIQALERAAPTKPTQPGLDEKREFEYMRHGTTCLTANFDVATGEVVAPSLGPTRNEQDFARHIEQTVALDPDKKWIFIVDNLSTHSTETLVRVVADHEGFSGDLGEKRVRNKKGRGILEDVKSRRAFLTDPARQVRFVFTPKHCSWLNQIEIWFSILARRVLKRSSFKSTTEANETIRAFIKYFNEILAKPFKWTYTGRALAA